MSSRANKIEKGVKHSLHVFKDVEMYNNILGSFLISMYILRSTDKTPAELCKFYKAEKKRWLKGKANEDTWMQDIVDKLNEKVVDTPDGHFIEHTGKTYIPYGKIAFVTSDWNCLIVPYVDIGKGKQILPIREDGLLGPTLSTGKVHEIIKEEETDGE